MKVLLLGEFSSFHNHLAAGLRMAGVDAVVAAGGDGYKKIQCDFSLESNYSGSIGRIDRQIKPFYKLPKLTGFDLCQSVSTMYPEAKLFSKTQFYRALKTGNKKLFFAAAGTDPTYCERAPKILKYTPLQDFYTHDVPKGKIRNGRYYMLSSKERKKHDELIQLSDGIIPVMYDYAACYQSCNKVRSPFLYLWTRRLSITLKI